MNLRAANGLIPIVSGFLVNLALLGIPVRYHTTTCDTLEAGVDAFRIAARRVQVVVATGGLGPTADDLTRDVLAEVSGHQLILSEQALEVIASRFSVRHAVMPESNRRQALFPEGSCPIQNPGRNGPWNRCFHCQDQKDGAMVMDVLCMSSLECRRKCAVCGMKQYQMI